MDKRYVIPGLYRLESERTQFVTATPEDFTSNGSRILTVANPGPSGPGITLAPIGFTPNENGASITSGVFNLQPADGNLGGVLSGTTQTIAGRKTFPQGIKLPGSPADLFARVFSPYVGYPSTCTFSANTGTITSFTIGGEPVDTSLYPVWIIICAALSAMSLPGFSCSFTGSPTFFELSNFTTDTPAVFQELNTQTIIMSDGVGAFVGKIVFDAIEGSLIFAKIDNSAFISPVDTSSQTFWNVA